MTDQASAVAAIVVVLIFLACLAWFVKLFDPVAYLKMRRYWKRRAEEARRELRAGGPDRLDLFEREARR